MRSLVVLAFVAGCAAPEPRASTPAPAPVVSSSPPALVVAPPQPAPPGPREVRSPERIACTLTGPTAQPVSLFAPGEAEPWATALAVARFELPADGDGAPVVSGESRAIRFRVTTRIDAIAARFAVAHFFGGVFLPEGARPLTITRVAASGVSVRSKAPRFLVSSAAPFVATVPCGDLTVDEDAAPALGGRVPDPRKAKMRALRPGTKIPLRASPEGDPAAVLEVGTDPALGTGPWVWITGASGDHTRLFLRDQDGVFDGWVPNDALLPLPPNKVSRDRGGGGSAVGGLWGTPTLPAAAEAPVRLTCADEVELFVALGSEVHLVGRVLANAPMLLVQDGGERTRVAFERGVLDAAERAKVFVRTAALVGCARGAAAE